MKRQPTVEHDGDWAGREAGDDRKINRIAAVGGASIRFCRTSQAEFQAHSHVALSVTAVLRGDMDVVVGDESFTASAGESILTDSACMHAARAEREVEFVSIHVEPELVVELSADMGLASIGAEIRFKRAQIIDGEVFRIAERMASEVLKARSGRRQMLDALLREVVVLLLRSHLSVRKSTRIELSRAGPVDRRLRRAIEFIHDNYASDVALGEMAAAAYLSEYHFARLFKQVTGVTPHVYLANVRLERARSLLTETSLPIVEVAAMVGYQSQSHFTRLFKSVTGVTPGAYRHSFTG